MTLSIPFYLIAFVSGIIYALHLLIFCFDFWKLPCHHHTNETQPNSHIQWVVCRDCKWCHSCHIYMSALSLCVCMLRVTDTKVIRCHPISVAIVMAQQNGSGKVLLHLLLLVGGPRLLWRKPRKQNRSKLGLCFHHVLHRGKAVCSHLERCMELAHMAAHGIKCH